MMKIDDFVAVIAVTVLIASFWILNKRQKQSIDKPIRDKVHHDEQKESKGALDNDQIQKQTSSLVDDALFSVEAFSDQRLRDMGLEDEEVRAFVRELIGQIETELPKLHQALQEGDFEMLERLTHSLKGSSINVGQGGVAELFSRYNTYLKSGNDTFIAKAYLEAIEREHEALKRSYGAA